jgi:hypothetical protein
MNSDIGSFDNRRWCFSVSIAIHYLAPEKERQRKGSGPIAGVCSITHSYQI